MTDVISINQTRLMQRIEAMAKVGAIDGGGVNRLALTKADALGRDLLVQWMKSLNMRVSVDVIGNIIGRRPGNAASQDTASVMTGSHLDSVATGGRYDGTLGVLAGLEVVETLNELDIVTHRPIDVGCFSNEEGARFAPDMLGSAVHQGSLDLDQAYAATDRDGLRFDDCLDAIGYRGDRPIEAKRPHAFVELHIEQGPVLEHEGITIGAVDSVQGISWTEYTIHGVSNHAGTTPMSMRTDAGFAAAQLACRVREIAQEIGGNQVATTGVISLEPNLVNVVARKATVTVDLRNVDDSVLCQAETMVTAAVQDICKNEGVKISTRLLARFQPVTFSTKIIHHVKDWATQLGYSVRQMPSGAGHDAQMFAPGCPAGMIFVPSHNGISHNIDEFTAEDDIKAGACVLANVINELANEA